MSGSETQSQTVPEDEVINNCDWYNIPCHADWAVKEMDLALANLIDGVLMAFADLINYLPVPQFLIDAEPVYLPAALSWAAEPFQLEYGLNIIVAAYVMRFTIKRIPFIGG